MPDEGFAGPEGIGVLDKLYELLELLDDEIDDLRTGDRRRVNIVSYPAISESVELVEEFGLTSRLGLSPIDLEKFRRISGTIDSATLRQLATRLKSLLKEAEGTIRSIASPVPHTTSAGQITPPAVQKFDAIEWVPNKRLKNGELIAELSELLNEAIERARGTNLPQGQAALSEFQREALIALLKTTTLMLQGPLVEKGLLKKLGEAAGEGATGAVKTGTEMGLGFALKRIMDLIGQLLANL
jgi:hypothetical protein